MSAETRPIATEALLRDAWHGEGNSKRITFLRWCQQMADNNTGVLQDAARSFLAKRIRNHVNRNR